MEDLLYEVESVRRFAGVRLTGPLPDETHLASLGAQRTQGHDHGRDDHRGAEFDEETRSGSGIRRCTRRRRATGSTSG